MISSGSSVATNDTVLVRERCARDVEVVEAILDGQQSVDAQGFEFRTITVPHGMELGRTGLSDDEVDRHVAQLPPQVARAVHGAVQELVRNAVKHSGADRVTVDVRHQGGTLIATVCDNGRGFDGRLIAGRGLAESVVARARDAGVDVAINTAPGAGTTVTLTITLTDVQTAPGEPADGSTDTRSVVEQIRRTACWHWAIMMVGFGVADVVIRRPPDEIAAYAMLAVVAGVCWLAAAVCRDGRTLPRWLTVAVLLAIPASFLAGLDSIDFGRSEVNDWPTIVTTALPVVLLITRRSRATFYVGIGLLALTAVATSCALWRTTPSAASVIPTGAATQLAILSAWLVLDHVIGAVGTHHQRTLRGLEEDRLERTARDRIIAARARWTNAGARTSLAVLRRIADCEVHPGDSHIQAECAEAERYLRQVLLLNPETVHMSPWIGRALSEARSKSVSLILRPGAADASSEELAAALGGVILAGVDALAPGAELGLGLFPGENGPQLLLVGPHGALRDVAPPPALPEGYTFTYQQFGAQDLIELAADNRAERPTEATAARRERSEAVISRG